MNIIIIDNIGNIILCKCQRGKSKGDGCQCDFGEFFYFDNFLNGLNNFSINMIFYIVFVIMIKYDIMIIRDDIMLSCVKREMDDIICVEVIV